MESFFNNFFWKFNFINNFHKFFECVDSYENPHTCDDETITYLNTVFNRRIPRFIFENPTKKTKSYIRVQNSSSKKCEVFHFRTFHSFFNRRLYMIKKPNYFNHSVLFLVGAFLGKSARLLHWLVFFSSDHRPHRVCTTFYRLHSRSHVLVSTRFTVNPAVTGSSPCFSQKFFRAIFFGTVRLFRNFFCRQRVPSTFLIFCSKLKFQKAQRVPPL